MSNTYRRTTTRYTDGRVAEICDEEFYLPAACNNPVHNHPQTYGCPPLPVMSLQPGPYYELPYQPRPPITSHPVPLTTYPDNDQATHYQPPSTYLPVPQQQFGGSYRGLIRSPSPSVASTLSVCANRIRDWDDDVDETSDSSSEDSVHSDAQYLDSYSRRSEKRDDRDRKQGDKKSRHGSVYSPSHHSGSDHRDRRSDAGSRVGGSNLGSEHQSVRMGSTALVVWKNGKGEWGMKSSYGVGEIGYKVNPQTKKQHNVN